MGGFKQAQTFEVGCFSQMSRVHCMVSYKEHRSVSSMRAQILSVSFSTVSPESGTVPGSH